MQHSLPHHQRYWSKSHFCRTPRLQTTRKLDTAISLLTGRRRAGTREAAGPAEGRSAAEPQAPTSGAHPRAAAPTPSAPLLFSLGVPLRAHRVRRPLPGSGGAAPGVRCRPGGSAPQRPPRCAPPAPRSPLPGGSKLWDALQRGGGSGAAAAERRRLRGAARSSRSPAATRRAGCGLRAASSSSSSSLSSPSPRRLSVHLQAARLRSSPRDCSHCVSALPATRREPCGATRPAGRFGAAPGLRAAPGVGTPRVPNPSPVSRPRGGCLRLPVGIAPVLSISSAVRGYKYLSGILIAASAERLVRVTQSSTNGPTRSRWELPAGCPGSQGGARLLQSWELR